jgi:hypothetical protein
MILEAPRRMKGRIAMKHELSPNQTRLLEVMQTINFGRIEELVIGDGEPVFDPHPRVVHVIKLSGENGRRPEMILKDFALRKEVMDLLEWLSRLDDGSVVNIEVKYGLPFKMEVENRRERRTA